MARITDVRKRDAGSKNVPPKLGKVLDQRDDDFDPEGDAFDTAPAPPDDGQYLVLLKAPKTGEILRTIEWEDQEGNARNDFSVRYDAECVDSKSNAFGRRWFGDVNTFSRKTKSGKSSNQVASLLLKAGVKPTGKKHTDAKTLAELIKKASIKVFGKSQWEARLKWDADASDEYKRRTKIVFLRGQQNFVNGKGVAVPLSEVPEDIVITKGDKEYKFHEGESLRTDARFVRFLSIEEASEGGE